MIGYRNKPRQETGGQQTVHQERYIWITNKYKRPQVYGTHNKRQEKEPDRETSGVRLK